MLGGERSGARSAGHGGWSEASITSSCTSAKVCSSSRAASAGSTGGERLVPPTTPAPAPVGERRADPLAAGQHGVAGGRGRSRRSPGRSRSSASTSRGQERRRGCRRPPSTRSRANAARTARTGSSVVPAVPAPRGSRCPQLRRWPWGERTLGLRVASIGASIFEEGRWTPISPLPMTAAVSCTNATAAPTISPPGCFPRGNGDTCTPSTASPATPTRSSTAPRTCRPPSGPPCSTDWAGRFVAGLHGAPVDDPLLPAVLHTIAVVRPRPGRLRVVPAQHGDGPDRHRRTRPTTTCSTTWRARRRSSAP